MIRYADTTVCPSCRVALPVDPASCPSCRLPLREPLSLELLSTLTHADDLVGRLRAMVRVPQAAGAGAGTGTAPPSYVDAPAAAPAWDPLPPLPPPPARGVRTTSVPAILLGLGALCLLVAALTFFAVAWSWLGLGGRTAVLVGLTVVSGGLGLTLARRGLRIAGEALTLVSLGLLVLDVLGAVGAGWLGDPTDAGLVVLVGLVVAAAGAALTAVPLPAPRVVAPQLVGVLALYVASVALTDLVDRTLVVEALAVALFAALALAGHRLSLTASVAAAATAATVSWLDLVLSALAQALDRPSITLDGLWLGGPGAALVVAAALLLVLVPVAHRRSSPDLAAVAIAASGSLLTLTLALPVLDESPTEVALAALVATLVWTALGIAAPARLRLAVGVPAVLSALPLLGTLLVLVGEAVVRVLDVGTDLTLTVADPLAQPLLLPIGAVALIALGWTLLPRGSRPAPLDLLTTAAPWAVVGLAGTAALALLPVPLWAVVAAVLVVGAGLVAAGTRHPGLDGLGESVVGGLVVLAAVVAALPSPWLLTLATAVLALLAAAVLAVARFPHADRLGGAALPLALLGLGWSAADLLGVDVALRAVPVLLVVGLLAIARPRVEVEVAAAVAVLAVAPVAVEAAADGSVSLALHLTLAGALVTTSALVHSSRRRLGWLGGALLALATWVRLSDLGVSAPEAYTLPTAVALVLVGLHRLRTDPDASTATALAPGLVLATVPSLLWVLGEDPVSLRAALLGLGCLALVLAGTRLRWSAPVVVGGLVGALLVLREVAPYAAQTPQWVAIGVAGTLLTVVGVTWERRVQQLRTVTGYVGRLR